MKFTENMLGKWAKEITSGDIGIIVEKSDRNWWHGEGDDYVNVLWKSGQDADLYLTIGLHEIEFIDPPSNNPEPEEITINGIRYKLVRIED